MRTPVRVDPLVIRISELQRTRDKAIQAAWEAFEALEGDAWRSYNAAVDEIDREQS